MAFSDSLQRVLQVLTPTLHFVVLVVMLRRKLVKTFPVFFAFTVFQLIRHFTELAFLSNPTIYFWIWYGAETINIFLTLAVIQELFSAVFAPYEALRKRGVLLFRGLTVLLCILAAIPAISSPVAEINRTMAAIFALDRSVQFVQLGLLFCLFLLCKLFGMTWRHYSFGIAAGFFVITVVSTANVAIRAHVGQAGNLWLNIIGPLGYTLGNLTWTYYFVSHKSVVPLKLVPRTDQLIAWNQALTRVEQR